MINKMNCWVIANMGWLTLSGFVIFVVIVRYVFPPTMAEKLQHHQMMALSSNTIQFALTKYLLSALALFLSIRTAIYSYTNYENVRIQRLFRKDITGISTSIIGYAASRFLMAVLFFLFIAAYILSGI
jgi:hypothetical protein